MNNDTNSSMLSRQKILCNKLNDIEINKFKDIINKINQLKIFSDNKINNKLKIISDNINSNKVDMKQINWIIKILEKYEKKIISKKKEIEEIKDKLIQFKNDISLPIKRLLQKEKKFIDAMIEGGIVLIDGIENAPFQIIEKILGLCEEKRRLDLFEFGEKYYFSEDAENKEQKIHKDFYLFITYNPENQIEKKSIEVLLNKCISFSIPEIDKEQKFIAQVFYGIFINNNFSKKDAENISLKLSKIHELAKEKSIINNSELIAGNIPFNGRSLIYFSRFFNKLKYKNLDKFSKSIKDGIINIYLKPFIKLKNEQQDIIENKKSEKEKFKEELFKIFQEKPNYIDFNILTQNEDDINLTSFLNYLSKIEQVINNKEKNNKKEIEFNLSDFINNICQYLKIKYLFYAEKDKNIIENIKKKLD